MYATGPGGSEQEWQECQIALPTEATNAHGTPAQDHLEALIAMLPVLQKSQHPGQKDTRRMAKLLKVPQHGRNLDMLSRSIQMTFVDLVLVKKCDLGYGKVSGSRGEHPAFEGLLEEVLALGRMPKKRGIPKERQKRTSEE